jgi:hypothetical protein
MISFTFLPSKEVFSKTKKPEVTEKANPNAREIRLTSQDTLRQQTDSILQESIISAGR